MKSNFKRYFKNISILSIPIALVVAITVSFGYSQTAFAEEAKNNSESRISIVSDKISYDNSNNLAIAEGNVSIIAESGSVWADKIVYNKKTGEIKGSGNVIFAGEDNTTIFLDKITLNEKMDNATLEKLRFRLGKGGPALAAEKAEKTADGKITLINATYSPCTAKEAEEKSLKASSNDKDLLWKIRASKITYDKVAQKISYKNAVLDVYGLPIFYIPYLSHPIGEGTAESGFLPPRFGSSTSRGEEVTLSYYYNVSPQEDYTIRTKIMSEKGTQLRIQRRYKGEKSQSDIHGSIISDEITGKTRNHLELSGRYMFETGKRIGINSITASDDTYLDDLFEQNHSYLTSTIYAEDASLDHYYGISGTWFQDLRVENSQGDTAQILPSATLEKVISLGQKGENLKLSGQVISLYRDLGDKSRKMISQARYERPHISKDGSKWTVAANIRGDIYHIDADETISNSNDGFKSRLLTEASIDWGKSYVSSEGGHIITPKAMAIIAPKGGNPDEIPNEDSVVYELDTSNLFSSNRFAGVDRVETGTRLIYGIDNHWRNKKEQNLRVFIGQAFRLTNDNKLPELGGAATKISDWVGEVAVNTNDWIRVKSKFRLDNATFDARRTDTTLHIGRNNKRYFETIYSLLDHGPEEVQTNFRYSFNNTYSVEGLSRRDLRGEGKTLLSEGSLIYTHQCCRFAFTAKRRGFDNRNVPPATDYMLNIELLGLGRDRD